MGNYTTAIEVQAAERQYFRSRDALEMLRWATERDPSVLGLSAEKTCQVLSGLFEHADPFYVASDICLLLERGAESYPERGLDPSSVPCGCGWIYLERPLTMPQPEDLRQRMAETLAELPRDGRFYVPEDAPPITDIPALQGLLWSTVPELNKVLVYFFGYLPGRPMPGLLWTSSFEGGVSWRTSPEGHLGAEVFNAYSRYLMSLWEFMRQRILTVSTRPASPRQARKRLRAILKHEPTVKVVQLRAHDYKQQGDQGEGEAPEWSCRWLVRGHWRNQWYPGMQEHRPVWIVPYIKGPEDKPLVLHDGIAYEVVR